jgi:hypothetical protein
MPIGHFEPREPSHSHEDFGHTADTWGIHPLNAGASAALDFMLFSGELVSGGLLVLVSCVVAAAFMLPATLVQRYAYKDSWPLAAAKGAILSLILAIPTAAPAALTAAWGAAGVVGLRYRARHAKVIDIEN